MQRTVQQCRALLDSCDPADRERLLRSFARDKRAAVRELAHVARRRDARDEKERERLLSMTRRQAELHAQGLRIVAGVDEVGRGCLAGPVTACAVILPVDAIIEGLDDSKRLTAAHRVEVAERIRAVAIAACVAQAEAFEIDVMGIANATRIAIGRAIEGLALEVDHVLVDGNDARIGYPATAVVGGDATCSCIAAASVLAKVHRDALMERLAVTVTGYGFELNKGYGTAEHLAAIRLLGPSAEHRRSFAPCATGEPLF